MTVNRDVVRKGASERAQAAKILKAAIGRAVVTNEDMQEAIVRVVFAAKIGGLTDIEILRAFLGAWPFASEAKLRTSVATSGPRSGKKRGASPRSGRCETKTYASLFPASRAARCKPKKLKAKVQRAMGKREVEAENRAKAAESVSSREWEEWGLSIRAVTVLRPFDAVAEVTWLALMRLDGVSRRTVREIARTFEEHGYPAIAREAAEVEGRLSAKEAEE